MNDGCSGVICTFRCRVCWCGVGTAASSVPALNCTRYVNYRSVCDFSCVAQFSGPQLRSPVQCVMFTEAAVAYSSLCGFQ
jgi:hypothetical protein